MKAARVAALGMAVLMAPAAMSAQETGDTGVRQSPAVVLLGGFSAAEADSLDAGIVLGIGLEFPLADWIVLAPSVERRTVGWPAGDRQEWHLDFGFQAEYPVGPARPYLGVAVGAQFDFRDDRAFSEEYVIATYTGVGGVRYALTDWIGLRAEARYRFLDGLEGGVIQGVGGIRVAF